MAFQTFLIAFMISFFGSIPPGTINVSVMQLSFRARLREAIFLAIAASVVEFCYAGVTVKFHLYLSQNDQISGYFSLITAVMLVVLGLYNLIIKPGKIAISADQSKGRHGFVKGILLGLLNPLTIPFWLAMTTYLETNRWISLEDTGLIIYLLGLSLGTFFLLLSIVFLGGKFISIAENKVLVQRVPGLVLLGMGVYFLFQLYA